jgi:hypothetical protein
VRHAVLTEVRRRLDDANNVSPYFTDDEKSSQSRAVGRSVKFLRVLVSSSKTIIIAWDDVAIRSVFRPRWHGANAR